MALFEYNAEGKKPARRPAQETSGRQQIDSFTYFFSGAAGAVGVAAPGAVSVVGAVGVAGVMGAAGAAAFCSFFSQAVTAAKAKIAANSIEYFFI